MPLQDLVSQSQWSIQIPELAGTYWSKRTAPKEVRASTKYVDPQTGRELTHVIGKYTVENVTLTHLYSVSLASAIKTWWKSYVNSDKPKFTVTSQPIQANTSSTPLAGSQVEQMLGCQVLSIKGVEVDHSATGMAMIEIEISIDEIA
jgi:hypothetical protein